MVDINNLYGFTKTAFTPTIKHLEKYIYLLNLAEIVLENYNDFNTVYLQLIKWLKFIDCT